MKQIKQAPEYSIDRGGNVYSTYKPKTSKITSTVTKLKPVLDTTGYYIVTLVNKTTRKRRNYAIHRLLAEAFIPNPLNKPMVNHIDGDKANNNLENLEWVTAKENSDHAIKLGLTTFGKVEKPIVQLSLDGEVINSFKSARDAYKVTGVRFQNISKVLRGHRNTAGGFQWKYK